MLKNLLKKRLGNEKGMTLIELLAVIVILAIVAAIAVPAIGGIIDNQKYSAVKADAINVINAANLYYADTPDATGTVAVSVLVSQKYLESAGEIPPQATITATSPRALTTTAITFAGSNTVTFSAATIDSINADKSKGSSGKNKTIDGTADADNDANATNATQ